MSVKKILLTGGGSAGHVTPNIALLPSLEAENYEISYVGSFGGIEKELIEAVNIPYYPISTGKMRRYLSVKNITDIFRVAKGLRDASKVIKEIKPDVIFSKGGFVSVPVVLAGKLSGTPIIVHESDLTPGLANKISYPFASAVCASFPETLPMLPKGKGVLTGTPIRGALFKGDVKKGLDYCGFDGKKPVLLVTGGSLGSVKINEHIYQVLDTLLETFDIAHLCGKGHLNPSLNRTGYKQFEYVNEQLPDLFACSGVIVSRAGANSIYEFLALQKPNLLIPLSKNASRGDQILNAKSFEKQGLSSVLLEEELTGGQLVKQIMELYQNRERYIGAMSKSPLSNGVDEIVRVILRHTKTPCTKTTK